MKKEFKIIFITVAVLSVLQLIGGTVYTAWTASQDELYTYVDCTVVSVQSVTEGDTLKIEGITVSYVNENGEVVTAQMEDFPSSFSIGEVFSGRYLDDPLSISAKKTDWFTPVFLIILGAAYAIFDLIAFLLRKKMGLYAMVSPYDYEDDEDEIADEDTDLDDIE